MDDRQIAHPAWNPQKHYHNNGAELWGLTIGKRDEKTPKGLVWGQTLQWTPTI